MSRPLTAVEARLNYLSEAAYFFLRATGDEQMVSALHRIGAAKEEAVLVSHGWAVPTPEETRAFAVELFGEDRCHA